MFVHLKLFQLKTHQRLVAGETHCPPAGLSIWLVVPDVQWQMDAINKQAIERLKNQTERSAQVVLFCAIWAAVVLLLMQ